MLIQKSMPTVLKLRSKLIEFSINNVNDCLEVLDTVVVNQDAFEKFEQKLGDKKIPAVYIQIPDDFPYTNLSKNYLS